MNLKYIEDLPQDFIESADVIFTIADKKYPAHSQILRMQSKIISDLINSIGNDIINSKNPFIISQDMLSNFTPEDVELFLSQIYNFSNTPIISEDQAHKLFVIADMFESSKIMKRCVNYFSSNDKDFLQINNIFKWMDISEKFNIENLKTHCMRFIAENYLILNNEDISKNVSKNTYNKILAKIDGINVLQANTNENGALKWLLLAEKYNLVDLKESSINFIADNYDILLQDKRLLDISIESYHSIANKIQNMINIRRKKDHNRQYHETREWGCDTQHIYTLYYYCKKNSCNCHIFETIRYTKIHYNCWRKPSYNEWNVIISEQDKKNKDCYGNLIKIYE